jgi:hypothetical protein
VRIFVSYARRDRDAVDLLLQDMRRARHDVWVDEELTGGQSWWDTILGTIRGADLFVVADHRHRLHCPHRCRQRPVDHRQRLRVLNMGINWKSADGDSGRRRRSRIDGEHQQADSFSPRREVVGDTRRNLAFWWPHGERRDCSVGGQRLGPTEQLVEGGQVPLVIGSIVALRQAAAVNSRNVADDGFEARHPLGAGIHHRLLDELVACDREHHVNVDPEADGLFEHDEVGTRGCGRYDIGWSQRLEQPGDARLHDRHLSRRKSNHASAGQVDAIARVNQQHVGRVSPMLASGETR